MPNVLVDKLRSVIGPPVEAGGYELVDVEWKNEHGAWLVRVYIDRADPLVGEAGPVGHLDCERVSREVSVVLDVNDVVPHAYTLEVSSPGLDRPLRTPAHFRRFLGQKARVKLVAGIEGRRNFSGNLTAVADDGTTVTIQVDGREFVLPLADLDKANLEFELKKAAPPGRRQSK